MKNTTHRDSHRRRRQKRRAEVKAGTRLSQGPARTQTAAPTHNHFIATP